MEQEIYENLTRKQAIDFLVSKGYMKDRLMLSSNNTLAWLWDKEHREVAK